MGNLAGALGFEIREGIPNAFEVRKDALAIPRLAAWTDRPVSVNCLINIPPVAITGVRSVDSAMIAASGVGYGEP